MLPPTARRVSLNTAPTANERIRQMTEANIEYYGSLGAGGIARRLRELDQEWDVERCLETMAPSFSLAGLLLGLTVSKKWLLLPVAVQAFFLQHALQGWCPPLTLLRRLGIRTAAEISHERYTLMALRGDFRDAAESQEAGVAAVAVRSVITG
jgi:hypothetical protein